MGELPTDCEGYCASEGFVESGGEKCLKWRLNNSDSFKHCSVTDVGTVSVKVDYLL